MHASSDTSGVARRRFLKGALATAAGGVLVPAVAARSWAADLLPEVGQTVDLSVSVFGAVMTSGLQPGEQTLNFIGSRMVRVMKGGPDYVQLQTINFMIEASHPLFGRITMRLPDVDVSPVSTLRTSPDGFTEIWYASPEIAFDRSGDLAGPFVLSTEKPLESTATLQSWPPPPQAGTNPDGSPAGGVLYSAVQLPTFTAADMRVDFTTFAPRAGVK